MTPEIYTEFIKSGTILSKDKNTFIIGWGARHWSQNPLNAHTPDFYFPDFFLKIGMPWFTHDFWAEVSTQELLKFSQSNEKQVINWETSQQPFFENQLTTLLHLIETQELKKAVPYLFQTSATKMTPHLLQSTLASLCNYITEVPAEIYGLWQNQEGFLGATPEILFKVQNPSTTLETVACAGTFQSHEEAHEAPCEKIILEHEIVVQGIEASLAPFGEIRKKPLEQITFKTLTHLITPITVSLHEKLDFTKVVRSLHPTPALGASPKEKGMRWLEQYQMGIPRGRYGAPAGFQLGSHATCVVAIRNVQWDSRGMQIAAGCGVVNGSTLDSELQEIKLKLQAIKDLLNL